MLFLLPSDSLPFSFFISFALAFSLKTMKCYLTGSNLWNVVSKLLVFTV